jgi:hypothetical protein
MLAWSLSRPRQDPGRHSFEITRLGALARRGSLALAGGGASSRQAPASRPPGSKRRHQGVRPAARSSRTKLTHAASRNPDQRGKPNWQAQQSTPRKPGRTCLRCSETLRLWWPNVARGPPHKPNSTKRDIVCRGWRAARLSPAPLTSHPLQARRRRRAQQGYEPVGLNLSVILELLFTFVAPGAVACGRHLRAGVHEFCRAGDITRLSVVAQCVADLAIDRAVGLACIDHFPVAQSLNSVADPRCRRFRRRGSGWRRDVCAFGVHTRPAERGCTEARRDVARGHCQ